MEKEVFWTMSSGSRLDDPPLTRPEPGAFSGGSPEMQLTLLKILGSSLLTAEELQDARDRGLLTDDNPEV